MAEEEQVVPCEGDELKMDSLVGTWHVCGIVAGVNIPSYVPFGRSTVLIEYNECSPCSK